MGSYDSEAEANYACDNRLDQLNKSHQNSSRNDHIESTINVDQNRSYLGRDNFSRTAEQAKDIWDELSSLSQRYLLLKATKTKLINLQVFSCTYQTDALLKSLNEEMVIVGVAKAQLEEALQKCFEEQLILTQI